MNKLIVCATLICASMAAMAQPSKPATTTAAPAVAQVADSVSYHVKLYQNAMIFADYMVAKEAMFNLITQNPNRIDYLDSLARIYYALGGMSQSLLAAKIVLDKQPDNLAMMELCAISYDALGDKKQSLETYEKLYSKTKDALHLYQISVLQFSLQRWGECQSSCDALLKDGTIAEKKVNITYDQQNSQEVPIKAAVHNLRGVMYKEMKDDAKAKPEFEEALKLYPEFLLAQSNLEVMNKPAEGEKSGKKK